MSFFNLILKGIIIGVGIVIPGVSGAVLAVMFGIYDKMLNAINNIFRKTKESIVFLLPIAIGIIIGITLFSNIILMLYSKNESIAKIAFIGLILGGVPYLIKDLKLKTNNGIKYTCLLLSFVFSCVLFLLNNGIYINNIDCLLIYLLAGFIYASGKIIPGISGSFILIIFNMYEFILSVLANPFSININELYNLLLFIAGFIMGIVFFIKLINRMLNKRYQETYSLIIGFVLGSILVLIPSNITINDAFISSIIFILCFVLSYKTS